MFGCHLTGDLLSNILTHVLPNMVCIHIKHSIMLFSTVNIYAYIQPGLN